MTGFGTIKRGLDSAVAGFGTAKRRFGSTLTGSAATERGLGSIDTELGRTTRGLESTMDAKACSLACDLAISVSKVKSFSSCLRRNLCSSRNWRFLKTAASAFNSAMRAASFALTTDRD